MSHRTLHARQVKCNRTFKLVGIEVQDFVTGESFGVVPVRDHGNGTSAVLGDAMDAILKKAGSHHFTNFDPHQMKFFPLVPTPSTYLKLPTNFDYTIFHNIKVQAK